jgi:uncharacterized protein
MPTRDHRSSARWNTFAALAVLTVGLLGAVPLAGTGPAQVAFPSAPAPGRFVVDDAKLIAPLDQVDLEGLATELKREHGYPIAVITIRSLAAQGASGYTIERYASEMLKAWPADAERQGYGLTLLVAADDRLARIELGSAWRGGAHDGRAREIMDHLILPAFRRGEMSKGILSAVKGFDAMGRGRRLPGESMFGWLIPAGIAPADQPWWLPLALVGGVFALVAGVISLARSGRKGLAWAVVGFVGVIFLSRLIAMATGRDSGDGDSSTESTGATGKW